MMRVPPSATRSDTRVPFTTLFRSAVGVGEGLVHRIPDAGQPRAGRHRPRIGRRALEAHRHELLQPPVGERSEEHTSELQSLMRISYGVFCLNKQTNTASTLCVSLLCTTVIRDPRTALPQTPR